MAHGIPSDPDLEALVRRLNAAARDAGEPESAELPQPGAAAAAPPAEPSPFRLTAVHSDAREWMGRILGRAREAAATDVLLASGAPPVLRVNGGLAPLQGEPLSASQSEMLCAALVPPERRAAVTAAGAVDFGFSWPGLGRFRGNVHRERGGWAAAVRLFPRELPELEDLNLPACLEPFTALEHGLVLVTGPTGSGKSTTLAALLRRIMSRRTAHVITIEDPVEYEHPHGRCIVEHVEIGRDAPSFAAALRSALRQSPDVLLVGEMRDRDSIAMAITAAETGHLVLSTLHTRDAPQTISRILDTYPPGQLEAVRAQISVSLAGVVSQVLLPRVDGTGRVPAVEVLQGTDAVRNIVRQGKLERLPAQITLERSAGMLSLDESLATLVVRGLVAEATARARARHAMDFERYLERPEAIGPPRGRST